VQAHFLRSIIAKAILRGASVELQINVAALVERFATRASPMVDSIRQPASFSISCPFHFNRQGKALRLVVGAGRAQSVASSAAIIRAVVRARLWYDQIVAGEVRSLPELARMHGLTPRYVNRIFRFASLGPGAVEAILGGECGASISLNDLVHRIPIEWAKQDLLLV
jgi:hypothetical protein